MNYGTSSIAAQRTSRLYDRSWKRANNTPLAAFGANVGILPDERIYMVGGQTISSNNASIVSNVYFGTIRANDKIDWIQASTGYGGGAMVGMSGCVLSDGRILSVCGYRVGGGGIPLDVYLGTPTSSTINWVKSTDFPAVPSYDATWSGRYGHTCTLLKDNRVIVIGGHKINAVWNGSAYIYYQISLNDVWFGTITGNSISWVQGTNLPESRAFHGACLLQDGRIAILGGITGSASQVGSYPPAEWETPSNHRRTIYLGTITGNTVTWVQSTDFPNSIPAYTATGYLRTSIGSIPNDSKNRFFVFNHREYSKYNVTGTVVDSTTNWTLTDFGTEFRNTILENNEEKLLFSRWPVFNYNNGNCVYVPSKRRFYSINAQYDVITPDSIQFSDKLYPDGNRASFSPTSSVVYSNCI